MEHKGWCPHLPHADRFLPVPLSVSSPLNQGKVEVGTVWTRWGTDVAKYCLSFSSFLLIWFTLELPPLLGSDGRAGGRGCWGQDEGCCPFRCKMHIGIIKPQQHYCVSTFWVELCFFKPVSFCLLFSLPFFLLAPFHYFHPARFSCSLAGSLCKASSTLVCSAWLKPVMFWF